MDNNWNVMLWEVNGMSSLKSTLALGCLDGQNVGFVVLATAN